MGAVVEYSTRTPKDFEAEIKATGVRQPWSYLGAQGNYGAEQLSAHLGGAENGLSWTASLNHADTRSQPLTFPNRLLSSGTTPTSSGQIVSGAEEGLNPRNQAWLLLGTGSEYHSTQTLAKGKLQWRGDTLNAQLTLANWLNHGERLAHSFLRNSSGQEVNSGNVVIAGRQYALTASDFAPVRVASEHTLWGLRLGNNNKSAVNWQVNASQYRYGQDDSFTPTVVATGNAGPGAGRATQLAGSGWENLAIKLNTQATPQHTLEGGVQLDRFHLRQQVNNLSDWRDPGSNLSQASYFGGDTSLGSLWLQDHYRAEQLRATVGARLEQWQAHDGRINTVILGGRKQNALSPKLALGWWFDDTHSINLATAKSTRFPTVSELYQGSIGATGLVVSNDPNLKPERSHTTELSYEINTAHSKSRLTAFYENTFDALYSQTNVTVTPNVVNIQNVDHIRTQGIEGKFEAQNVLFKGLQLAASLTYANSLIVANRNFPDSVGKLQPRVPRWRGNVNLNYALSEHSKLNLGLRYSGKQFNTLDNADPNGMAYTGTSQFLVADLRVTHAFNKAWQLALGIDNINNAQYWAFHPYPQRSFMAELRWRQP
ncbi:MAG: Vitamin transporter BtuB [Pseudomonadota bacterium]